MLNKLPVNQINESQRSPMQRAVESDTKVVQAACRGQPKGVEQLVVDGFHQLPQARQPWAPLFRPFAVACLVGRRDDFCTKLFSPSGMRLGTCKSFVGYVDSMGRLSNTAQGCCRVRTGGQEGFDQPLIMAAGCPKAEPGNQPFPSNSDQQVKPFVPAEAVAPANIGLACQPSCSTPFRISGGNARGVKPLEQAVLPIHHLDQRQAKGRDQAGVLSLQTIELAARRQGWKGCSQAAFCIPIKRPFTWELGPLSKQSQRRHFGSRQSSLRARVMGFHELFRLAKIVDDDVEYRYECV